MKSFILSILFVASAIAGSQAWAQIENGAKIDFKKEVHDYGNLKHGANGVCTFEFTNTGNAPLIISQAEGSCGCTIPTWPKEPIAPGGKGTISVKYDTQRSGDISKTVKITSNAINDPVKTLRIKGSVGLPAQGSSPVNGSGPANH